MGLEDPESILFVGWGAVDGVTYYRSWLPSKALGAEAVVFSMEGVGAGRRGKRMKHDIIVVQHCWEHWQIRVARRMAKSGALVIVNCDDWIPGVAKLGADHSLSHHFKQDKRREEWKTLIREAHGVLASTPWLLEKLRTLNPNVALARNGLDLDRYERCRTEKTGPIRSIGWAGGTGHEGSFRSIVPAITEIMDANPELEFMVVGDAVQNYLPTRFKGRVHWFKWSDMRLYPNHLNEIDLNLAPAMDNDFFRAKSQLRFYEACAMGNPTVGHKDVYDEIWPLGTGMKPSSLDKWMGNIQYMLNRNEAEMRAIRRRCLDYAQSISIDNRIAEWKSALTQLTSP